MIFLYLLIYLKQFIGACPRIVATKEHKVIRFDSFIALIITNVNKVLIKWFFNKALINYTVLRKSWRATLLR